MHSMPSIDQERGAHNVSRRSFLFVAGAVASLAALSGCSPSASEQESSEDELSAEDQPLELTEEERRELAVASVLGAMTLEEKVAQLFIVPPESITGFSAVTQAGDQTKASLIEYPVGGLIYFAQNLEDEQQTKQMLETTQGFAQESAPAPLFLCVDEEGGTVTRIGGMPGFSARNVGDMATVGATGDVAEAESIAREIGSYLAPLGFNVDFAPDADIAASAQSMMADRSFGSDPTLVSEMVAAQVKGFDEAGMLCCVKHFPGIGSSFEDSHTTGIVSDKTLEEILASELLPFQAAIDAGVEFVMVGHISMPNITGDDTPASLSAGIVQDILRDKMGYKGIVITDALGMGAVANAYSSGQTAVMALQAGCDIPLMPADFPVAYQSVLDAVRGGTFTEERIDESVKRILRVKLGAFPRLFDNEIQDIMFQ